MIDYSVYMMGNPIKPTEPAKAYAKCQVSETWNMERFARHIANHNGVYSRGTVKGVIADMCECIVEQLLNGNKIQLGELGTFGISISCEGAESIEKFSAKNNIKEVNILFMPGEDFENLVDRAEFNQVSSRFAQAATLKAEKAGETIVDLAAAKAGSSTPDNPTSPGSGNSGSSGGGDSSPL